MKDLDDESYPEKKRRAYRCKDRMCGAVDCANCFPNTYDEPHSAEEREAQEQFEKYGKIITQHVFPPMPVRTLDWLAYQYGYEDGLKGWGETEEEAIADLKQQIDEE
jgi:hypothetical protein